MDINYKNKKVEKQCTDLGQAKKDFPMKVAKKLHKLINFIEAAENLESIINMHNLSFHPLTRNREGEYSMDIDGRRGSYRLITSFKGASNDQIFADSISIKSIKIEEVSKHYE